jgi:hypothetical protein
MTGKRTRKPESDFVQTSMERQGKIDKWVGGWIEDGGQMELYTHQSVNLWIFGQGLVETAVQKLSGQPRNAIE